MNSDWKEAQADFDRDGYAVLRAFLRPDEAAEILRQVERFMHDVVPNIPRSEVFCEVPRDLRTIKQIQRMYRYDPYFTRLAGDEKFTSLAKVLLRDGLVLENLQWLNKAPRLGTPTPPHQDGYYFMIEPNEAVTLWLALDTVDQTNGCVRYVPGSHRRGMREHNRTQQLGFSQGIFDYGHDEQAVEVAIHAQPGDLIAHHSMTIHRADPNPSERSRRALGFTYLAHRAREDVSRGKAYQTRLVEELTAAGKI